MQHITLQGAGQDVTKITEKNVAGDSGTTYTSSTFGVSAPYFSAYDISFEVLQLYPTFTDIFIPLSSGCFSSFVTVTC
jgi:hypothetical protein